MNKKMLTLLLFALVLLLSSCEETYNKVPLILYNDKDPYISEFKQHILNEAYGKITIDDYDSENSQILQNEYIDYVLNKNPNIMIINPVDRLAAFSIIEKVKQYDIPIIFINREPLKVDMNSWNKLYYLGAPAENSAVIQSEMIIDLFKGPDNLSELDKNGDGIIQLVVLKGEQGHQDAEIRTEVVIQELEDYGYKLDILNYIICDWQTSIAYEKMNEFLLSTTTIPELVISNNDAMAIGAIEAMIENELFIDTDNNGIIDKEIEPWIPVIGVDGISEAFDYIEQGYLFGTVINDSETMSRILIELTQALINNTDLNELSFEITNGKYIWIDYQRYEKEED
jgi:methyl-galactoside transport system substrate-binding protein